jgi:hypothetical protein
MVGPLAYILCLHVSLTAPLFLNLNLQCNSMNNTRAEEILKSVEHHHEQYIKSLRLLLFEAPATSSRMTRSGSNESTPSPLLKAVTFGSVHSTGERARRLTNESPKTHPVTVSDGLGLLFPGDEHGTFLPLTPPSHTTSAKTEGFVPSISRPLPRESFSEEDLVDHIHSIDENNQHAVTALGDVWQQRAELDASNVLGSFESGEGSRFESATYQVYEVARNGTPELMQIQAEQAYFAGGDGDGDIRDASVWSVLKDTNVDGNAVGRMT